LGIDDTVEGISKVKIVWFHESNKVTYICNSALLIVGVHVYKQELPGAFLCTMYCKLATVLNRILTFPENCMRQITTGTISSSSFFIKLVLAMPLVFAIIELILYMYKQTRLK